MRLPALVEPGPPLTAAEAERTARHTRLPELGELGQRRLHAARVLVLGAGGLGAPSLLYLAAAGVGTIGIVDDDEVDISNLHRQVIHSLGEVGAPKTASAARRLREVAPEVVVVEIGERLTEANARDVLGDGWDVVLDGTDNFATRYLVADTCAELGVPLVWASVLRFDAQVSVFWQPPSGPGVTLRDPFPAPPAPGDVPSCADAGVLGALCGIVGSVMALEAIKLITGIGEVLLGRVAVIDALGTRIAEVPLASPLGERALPSPNSATPRPALNGSPGRGPLVDVREPGEIAATGDLVAGAAIVPVGLIEQAERAPDPRAALASAGLPLVRIDDDDAAPLRLYCKSGQRAQRAARTLRRLGIPATALEPEDVARLRLRAGLREATDA